MAWRVPLLLLLLPVALTHCWTPLDASHNGGVAETLTQPAAGVKPHILFLLVDDFGWSNAGWHRPPGSDHSHEVQVTVSLAASLSV